MSKENKTPKTQEEKIKPFTVPEILTHYVAKVRKSAKAPLYLGFKQFDDIYQGDLGGQMVTCMGYGGTRKSVAAMNNSNRFAKDHDARTYYSSMEMSKERLFARDLDYAYQPIYKGSELYPTRGSDELKNLIKSGNYDDRQEQKFIKILTECYGDRVLINDSSRMSIDDYVKVMETYAPRVLVVDGLSRMADASNKGETDSYSKNSGDLKDLTNDYDCFTILICHCSKTSGGVVGTKTTRNLAPYVRGSEKILDNCDFMMSYSLIENESGGYDQDYGWIRLEDKRNSGKIVDQIYKFNSSTLMMEDTNIQASTMETKKIKKGFREW